MRIISGYLSALLELINPYENIWYLRWNKWSNEDGDHWFEETIEGTPTIDQVKTIIEDFYNQEAQKKILEGFIYNDKVIWLSSENQMNYKSLFDLKAEKNVIKTSDGSYLTFESFKDYEKFYYAIIEFIQTTLQECWNNKDNFDYSEYKKIIDGIKETN